MIRRKPGTPPLADRILRLILDMEDYKEKSGDLEEVFSVIFRESGRFRAWIWYWIQVLNALPCFLNNRLYGRFILFKNHLKMTLRFFKRHKGYSSINLTGLTIGFACFLLILLWVQNELKFDRFHENKDRIYRILNKNANGTYANSITYALPPHLKENYAEVEMASRVCPWYGSLVKYKDRSFEEFPIYLTDPDFFKMFTFPFVQGTPDTALPDKHSVVLTQKTAQRYFGSENPLGKIIYMTEFDADFKVTGVVADIPDNSHLQFDMVTRVEWMGAERIARWAEWVAPAYVMFHKGVDGEVFNKKIAGIYREKVSDDANFEPFLQPLSKVYLYGTYRSEIIKKVYLFSLIAVFILVMACVNFMNLSTARSTQRAREIGMRKVIGATRRLVIRQFLGEAMWFSFLSVFLSLFIVWTVLPAFNHFTGKSLSLFSGLSVAVLGVLLAAAIFTGFFAGSYPALYLSSFLPADTLKNRIPRSTGGLVFRKVLIVFQFTISVGLILCTLIVSRQMSFVRKMDLGFNRDHVLTLFSNPELLKSMDVFKQEILDCPGVRSMTSAAQRPHSIGQMIPVNWEGNESEDMVSVAYTMVDYDFFKTFDMKILQGRSFSKQYSTDPVEACIINESAVKMMGLKNPIGTPIHFGHWDIDASLRNLKVVDVVNDFQFRSLHWNSGPFLFRIYRPWHQYIFVKLDGSRIPEALAGIEQVFKKFAPEYPFRFEFLDAAFGRQYATETQLMRLFNFFSLLAVTIACLGLFGLASYTAEQKRKEIGIRKVLGASISSIISLTTKDFLKWILAANLISWPVVYVLMSGWLTQFVDRVPITISLFFLAGILTFVVAFLTVFFQALKAALADPAVSLRCE
ncbi:MAG: ABC transporter permease [Candidatus Aminicenantes bacterium]|nr:ABC transporter permease [Candidatus Aminicenantes bacterium]